MDKKTFQTIKNSRLSVHNRKGIVCVIDETRVWCDSGVEFKDPTGELLTIKLEEKKLKSQLFEEMQNVISEFWESKEEEMMAIETEEIPKDVRY